MGVGIAITRGSAASLSFCYCLLLLTMSRNLLTKLKEFSIQQYIPLDSHIQFHKIAACTGLFFSLIHTVGKEAEDIIIELIYVFRIEENLMKGLRYRRT